MDTSRFTRFLPIAGVLAGLFFALQLVMTGPAPVVTDSPQERLAWFADNQGAGVIAAAAGGYFCVVMLLFVTGLRQALRSGEPAESTYSSAAFAGGIVVALSIAWMGLLTFAATGAADKGNLEAVTTIGFLDDVAWMPWVAGSAVLYLATGLGGLRTAVLPKWLAVATTVLGVLCFAGPAGIAVFFATPFWLVVTGIVLYRRTTAAAAVATHGVGEPGPA